MRGKRTNSDFSQHKLIVYYSPDVTRYNLILPNRGDYNAIKILEYDGKAFVTGDYGNWVFDRPFCMRSAEGVSDGYMIEKLGNLRESAKQYSEEKTEKNIERIRNEYLADNKDNEDFDAKTDEFLKALEEVDKESGHWLDMEYAVYRTHHEALGDNAENIIGYEYSFLEVIFDAIEEIKRRFNGGTFVYEAENK